MENEHLAVTAETCLRKILKSDETVTAKAEYLVEVLENEIRVAVIQDVRDAFEDISTELEHAAATAETRSDRVALSDAVETVEDIRKAVLKRVV